MEILSGNRTRLELTWVGKENRPRLEPRILFEESERSYHAARRVTENDLFDNRLIFGDNLLALKALEQEFAGKIKCVYIDPPYNTMTPAADEPKDRELPFTTPQEFEIARATLEVISKYESRPSRYDLLSPEILPQIVAEVSSYGPSQATLEGLAEKPNYPEIVEKTIKLDQKFSIDIPRIIVVPKGEVASGFNDFDLDVIGIRLQPVEKDILIQYLRTEDRATLLADGGIVKRDRLEDHLVVPLMDFDDICYDDHAGYEAHVSKGFTTLRPSEYDVLRSESARSFRSQLMRSRTFHVCCSEGSNAVFTQLKSSGRTQSAGSLSFSRTIAPSSSGSSPHLDISGSTTAPKLLPTIRTSLSKPTKRSTFANPNVPAR